ncbi:hypothetical protein NDU88_005871 [Pleurodeles waltl]|uniref:Uncharacterized protein n=1 Tax=Pleurodeles waltl TaxID=8319 RepID=A0AAV7ULD3_PLEWA|nr:hypothetical protein NDU88_005871 [Pleurodeles waltl]
MLHMGAVAEKALNLVAMDIWERDSDDLKNIHPNTMGFVQEVNINRSKVPALRDTGASPPLVERKYLKPEEIFTWTRDTGLVADGEGMELNGKVAMIGVRVREKQGAGILWAVISWAGPEAFMAWATSSVLTTAQAADQSQNRTEIIPDL